VYATRIMNFLGFKLECWPGFFSVFQGGGWCVVMTFLVWWWWGACGLCCLWGCVCFPPLCVHVVTSNLGPCLVLLALPNFSLFFRWPCCLILSHFNFGGLIFGSFRLGPLYSMILFVLPLHMLTACGFCCLDSSYCVLSSGLGVERCLSDFFLEYGGPTAFAYRLREKFYKKVIWACYGFSQAEGG